MMMITPAAAEAEAEEHSIRHSMFFLGTGPTVQTPDLNLSVEGSSAIVPVGLVNLRVSQLDGATEDSGESLIEKLKKQKRSSFVKNARSTAAANDSLRRAQ